MRKSDSCPELFALGPALTILGSVTTVMLMHYHYDKGLPLAPRTLFYPLFGDRAVHGPIGLIADAPCVIALVAGTVGLYTVSAITGLAKGIQLLSPAPATRWAM